MILRSCLALFCLLFLAVPRGQADVCCICETGLYPEWQIPAFEVGCQVWLASQIRCDTSRSQALTEKGSLQLPRNCHGDKLILGYVGHWISSWQTRDFIQFVIAPTMKKNKVSVYYDNSACYPMQYPLAVKKKIDELVRNGVIPGDKKLVVQGSQATSIGIWDYLFYGDTNVYATVSKDTKLMHFPKCADLEENICNELQSKDQIFCEKATGPYELTCCETKIESTGLWIRGSPMNSTTTRYKWQHQCH